ncbi:MAG: hypothetical protein ACKOZV_14115 [Bacteroidota bacterium]
MKISRIILALCLLWGVQQAVAQTREYEVREVVNRFFEGMNKGDTVLLKSACTGTMILQTCKTDSTGAVTVVKTDSFADFVTLIGAPRKNKIEERITFGKVLVEESLASVWAPYTFYLNGDESHTGTNSFQLVRTSEGWKIQYIIDTRRK